MESHSHARDGTRESKESTASHADGERALRRRGGVEVYSGITGTRVGTGGADAVDKWVFRSSHLEGEMVVTRLPFRAFQREDTQGYRDWIIGIDHLVGISVSFADLGGS